MGNWTDLLDDPRTIRAIFGDQVPSLSGAELLEFVLHQDGPSAMFRLELSDWPENPPAKWSAAGFNRVQIRLQAWTLRDVVVDGMTRTPR